MLRMRELVVAESVDQALTQLQAARNNVILGGTTFLRLGRKAIQKGIDLSALGLDRIEEEEDGFRIGAMVSYESLHRNAALRAYLPAFCDSLGDIVGTQFRNLVTVGASVFSRYGFSDMLPMLLALDAQIILAEDGAKKVRDFIDEGWYKDILLELWIPKSVDGLSHHSLRRNAGDIPMINLSLARKGNRLAVAVGARPGRAKLAVKTAELLEENKIEEAKEQILKEIPLGSNMRASQAYRRQVVPVLLERAWEEVRV